MNVVFVSTMISQPWGGSEELWFEIANLLAKQGFNVLVNVKKWKNRSPKLNVLEGYGVKVSERDFFLPKPNLRKFTDFFLPPQKRFNTAYDINKYLKNAMPCKVVICQGSNQDGLEWMEECEKMQIQFSTISQAASEHLWPNDEMAARLSKAFRAAMMNYFVSTNNFLLTQRQFADFSFPSKIARNPFNVSYKQSFDWPKIDTIKLAFVGRIHPQSKGQDLVLEVLGQKKWATRNFQLTIYGSGPNVESLKKLAAFFDVKNIVWAGYEHNVEKIWKDNHCLVLTSRYEGLPLSAVEACLCGRVCILTDVAGNKEIVMDNESGFIAEAPNLKFVDEAMERAWEKRKEWKKMGEVAFQHIRKVIPEHPSLDLAKTLIQDLEL